MTFSHAGEPAERLRLVEEHVRRENEHDLDAVMETFGSDARYDDEAWGERYRGNAAVRSFYAQLMHALPGLVIGVKQRYVTSDNVVLEADISGTHLGAWRGLPATGRRVSFPLCAIYDFDREGKLAGERIYYDRASVLRQLGIYREPTGPAGQLRLALSHPITVGRALVRAIFR